jgi:hypothetical protein
VCTDVSEADDYERFYHRHPKYACAVDVIRLCLVEVPRVRPIRLLLEATSQLSALELTVPLSTPRSVLPAKRLPSLTILKTNLEHSSIASFLSLNHQLESLTLGSCGTNDAICPLHQASLPSLTKLECRKPCIYGFSSSINITCLTLVHYNHAASNSVMNKPLPKLTNVTALSILFHPHSTPNPLRSVLSIAPSVHILELEEISTVCHKNTVFCTI